MGITQPYDVGTRLYLIWEQEGPPEGKALEHWLRAEAELSTRPATEPVPLMS